MIGLAFDTETNGIPGKHQGVRVVQLAMILFNEDGKAMAENHFLINQGPDFVIPEEAHKVHGFTVQDQLRYGVAPATAYGMFLKFAGMADLIIAHNMRFDWAMMGIEAAAVEKELPTTRRFCTMQAASPICNIPPTEKMVKAGFTKNKLPRLEEALKIMLGQELVGAHHAMNDCRGCLDIFFDLQARGLVTS